MSTNNELKVLHDLLLAEKPEGASHPDDCPFCHPEEVGNQDITPGGSMPDTFTQEQVDAAIAAAVADLQQRFDELGAQVQETEVGRAVAEAVAEKSTEVSDLQAQLDAAQAARTAAESALAETTQFWTDAVAQHTEQAAFAARRTERVAQAKEAGVFSEEYVSEQADRFAAMSDEDFVARLAEWKLIAAQAPSTPATTTGIPATTVLVAARATDVPNDAYSRLAAIGELHRQHVDPRTLQGGA